MGQHDAEDYIADHEHAADKLSSCCEDDEYEIHDHIYSCELHFEEENNYGDNHDFDNYGQSDNDNEDSNWDGED